MGHVRPLLLAALVLSTAASAQTTCQRGALPEAARSATAIRHSLHHAAVDELDPKVPPAIATELGSFKAALAHAAEAAFACAPAGATTEQLQNTLADALHANLSTATETAVVSGKKDIGAYGSDLAVQVFPLFNSPRYYEVDFRYGIECGDDNLLLVFTTDGTSPGSPWHEVLRWGTPSYSTVSDAVGDFVLLTPLSGFAADRNWRFIVAHGQPSCGAETSQSHFDLDLLQPTSDPASPTVAWHLERPYLRSQPPRMATTEDTLTFELGAPTPPQEKSNATSAAPAPAQRLRFRISRDNHVTPLTPTEAETPSGNAAPTAAPPPGTSSPQ